MAAELLLFRGDDRAGALARPANEGDGPVQVAIVARDDGDRAKKVALAQEGKAQASGVFLAADAERGKTAFLFPGQGSQRVGMLRDVFDAYPELAPVLALGARWQAFIYPSAASSPEEEDAQKAALTDTRVAQPALGIANLAMAKLLQRHGVLPDMVAGHSYGELVALCVAGALPEATLLGLSELRGQRILEATAHAFDPGTMAAIAADPATTAEQLAGLDGVVIANENAPLQSVISGPTRAVQEAVERLLAAGIAAQAIPVACAFHSALVQDACAAFARDLAAVDVSSPALPVYSNTTAALYPTEPDAIRARLAEHIGKPVRFVAEVEAMYADGARTFVEVGPGRVLTGLVGRVLGKRPHAAIACDRPNEDGVFTFLLALGQLAVRGVPVSV
ncbi:MAG: ACP S-malonyltransferase [Burkholderiales bacterium]|nr:ACP S-malonyltransferase [Burkholderiales bacterium]